MFQCNSFECTILCLHLHDFFVPFNAAPFIIFVIVYSFSIDRYSTFCFCYSFFFFQMFFSSFNFCLFICKLLFLFCSHFIGIEKKIRKMNFVLCRIAYYTYCVCVASSLSSNFRIKSSHVCISRRFHQSRTKTHVFFSISFLCLIVILVQAQPDRLF